MKHQFKKSLTRLNSEKIERVLALSLLGGKFDALNHVTNHPDRHALWDEAIALSGGGDILFMEFGVWQGYSLKYFAERLKSPDARFFGFDSFEGLPEDWTQVGVKKGDFDLGGKMPYTEDPRVCFVRGWFQDSVPEVVSRLVARESEAQMIIHYDGDLYSSTLFTLTEIDRFKRPYLAIFDEFYGHEARALDSYMQSHRAEVEFISRMDFNRWPEKVLCRITPQAALGPSATTRPLEERRAFVPPARPAHGWRV
jgi:hypothetical protein